VEWYNQDRNAFFFVIFPQVLITLNGLLIVLSIATCLGSSSGGGFPGIIIA
jgi:hypothetical protein